MNEIEIMQQPQQQKTPPQQQKTPPQKKKVEPTPNHINKLQKVDDRLQKVDDRLQKVDACVHKLDENFRQQQQLVQMVQTMQLQLNTLMHMVQMLPTNTNTYKNPSPAFSNHNHNNYDSYITDSETQGPHTAHFALEVNNKQTPGHVMPWEGERRLPKRTYSDFRKHMRKEMLVHKSDIENIRKDYTRVIVNIFIRHVEKERADWCEAPIKCGTRKSDLYMYERSDKDPEGTQKIWIKMEMKHIDKLAEHIMTIVNIQHDRFKDESTSMNQTTDSITHHMQVGKEIMEGIQKTSFHRTFKPQLYEALYSFGTVPYPK